IKARRQAPISEASVANLPSYSKRRRHRTDREACPSGRPEVGNKAPEGRSRAISSLGARGTPALFRCPPPFFVMGDGIRGAAHAAGYGYNKTLLSIVMTQPAQTDQRP